MPLRMIGLNSWQERIRLEQVRRENRGRKRKLKWQMMAFVIAIAFIITVCGMIVFQNMKRIIVRQYSDSALQSVTAVAKNMDYILQNVENQTNSILLNHEMMDFLKSGDEEEFCNQLTSYFVSGPYTEGIYIRSKEYYWHVGADIRENEGRFQEKRLAETTGEIIWLPTRTVQIQILSGLVPKNCFSLGRKLVDVYSLEELGYMVVEVNEAVLREVYQSLEKGGGEVFIVNKNGSIISSNVEDTEDRLQQGQEWYQKLQKTNDAGTIEFSDEDGKHVALYATFNRGEWKIIKTVPQATLYAEINQLQAIVLLGGIFFLSLILLIGYVYISSTTRPITRIIHQMKKVEAGDMSVRVDTKIQNEIGELGESFNHMVKQVDELMEANLMAERNRQELELEVLHAQINPHFLYNTLSTIRFMAKIKGEDSISSAILALTRLLRISITFGKDKIQLQEEISYVEDYLLIQRLRFNQRFQFFCEICEEHRGILVPKLILQPIVENSIIYGMEAQGEDTDKIISIRIYTRQKEEGVEVVVEDNGPGISDSRAKEIFRKDKNINRFSKVGLNNVDQRIRLYCGKQYGITIDSEPGKGTKIIIRLPRPAIG